MSARRAGRWGALAMGIALLVFLALPPLALVVSTSPARLAAGFAHELTLPAIRLSLFTSAIATALVTLFGLPLAWILARSTGRGWRVAETIVQLPIATPPAVAGVGLLLVFGRKGFAGSLGLDGLVFTTTAVVLSQVFVAAPFFLASAIAGFRGLDERLLAVARTLGAGPSRVFFEVAMPLARGPILAGIAMCWARALSEFGATLLFAGNRTGRTQTMPLAIYTTMESDLRAAQALALVLMSIGLVVLGVIVFTRRHPPGEATR